MIENVLSAST